MSVVVAHISYFTHVNVIYGCDLHGLGRTSVWLFFVLSAFLLTEQGLLACQSGSFRGWLSRYASSRIFRIYPVFVVFVLASDLLGQVAPGSLLPVLLVSQAQGVAWTIPVEVEYYVLVPVLVLALQRWPVWGVAMTVTATALSLTNPETSSLAPFLPTFVVGSLAALIHVRCPAATAVIARLWPASLLLVVLSLPITLTRLGDDLVRFRPWDFSSLLGLVWVPALYACLVRTKLGTICAGRSLRSAGRISYSLYLAHSLVITTVMVGPIKDVPCIGALTVALCLVVAWIVHRIVEAPGHRLGVRLWKAWPRETRVPAGQAVDGREPGLT